MHVNQKANTPIVMHTRLKFNTHIMGRILFISSKKYSIKVHKVAVIFDNPINIITQLLGCY